jgi:nicotinamide-nucleotide amidase
VCNRSTIILIGTEIIDGRIEDKHQKFLGRELTALGFSVRRIVQVPDDREILDRELSLALEESGLVITSGGLGPTQDDLTRDAVAEKAGVPLVADEATWAALKSRFPDGLLAQVNKKQALIPEGFQVLENAKGTAPGFMGRIGSAFLASLPGPPSELKPMFFDKLVPLLRERFKIEVPEKTYASAFLVPESQLEKGLQELKVAGLKWTTRLEEDRVIFSVETGDAGLKRDCLNALKKKFGQSRIRDTDESAKETVFRLFLERKQTFCTVESCTGGLLGKWMTDLPGSSRAYWGGFIVYSNAAKARLLDIGESLIESHGAVSGKVAAEMSRSGLRISGTGCAIAVTGIAGPDGGTAEKPVGTVWIAVSLVNGPTVKQKFLFRGNRDMVRRKTAVAALLLAESVILTNERLDIDGEI